MSSVHYAKLHFTSNTGKSVEVEISYELEGSDFDVEEINIDGAYYDMRKQSYARRKATCDYIASQYVDIWETIMEYETGLNDLRRESWELRDL